VSRPQASCGCVVLFTRVDSTRPCRFCVRIVHETRNSRSERRGGFTLCQSTCLGIIIIRCRALGVRSREHRENAHRRAVRLFAVSTSNIVIHVPPNEVHVTVLRETPTQFLVLRARFNPISPWSTKPSNTHSMTVT
jgi:hypothetical protein